MLKTMAKTNKNKYVEQNERQDRIELHGFVEEALPSTLFTVRCDNNLVVLCTLSGKLRLNRIRILSGDAVTIEVSPYDTSKGRIVWREKS